MLKKKMTNSTNSTKNQNSTKKLLSFGGFSKTVYDLLCVNPTTKYVMKKTGKSSNYVGTYINRLIQKGYIKRIGYGHYKTQQTQQKTEWVVNPNSTKKGISFINKTPKKDNETQQKEYFRLHNLEIELLISSDTHKFIKNLVFKKKEFDNIRSSGTNQGRYFDVGIITYMITSKRLFAFFPENWEIIGDNLKELSIKMYDEISKEINVLEKRYKIMLIKDDKICFNIRNIHIALVKNGIAKEFRKSGINNLVVYDEHDGKPRFIMDMSKGFDELEAVHPEKSFEDADEAKFFMDKLKKGKIREMILNYGELDEIKKIIHLLTLDLHKLIKTQEVGLINTELLTKSYTKTQLALEALTEYELKKKLEKESKPKDPPSYVG